MKLLVLGATGMLGNAMLRVFARRAGIEAIGSARSGALPDRLPADIAAHIVSGIDARDGDTLARLFDQTRPEVVINCVGLVKQLAKADDPLAAIPINALLPHRLARLCAEGGARLVHISTDCVFKGCRGNYTEDDTPNAVDLHGRSKLLGEVDCPNAVTLRTSIIGHELGSAHGLVEWFLAQAGPVKGYAKAIFSGLPTCELARVIADHVLPAPDMRGLWHVSAAPIDKLSLLRLVRDAYGRTTVIEPDTRVAIDRSLDSSRFRARTGYTPPDWPELVARMRDFG